MARFRVGVEESITLGLRAAGSTTTLTDYAKWWDLRHSHRFRASPCAGGVEVEVDSPENSLSFVLENAGRRAILPYRSSRYVVQELPWLPATTITEHDPVRPPTGLHRLELLVRDRLRRARRQSLPD